MRILHKLSLLVVFAAGMAWTVGYLTSSAGELALHREISRSSQLRVQSIMREISQNLHNRIIEWQAISRSPEIRTLLDESNSSFSYMPIPMRDEQIALHDKKWREQGAGYEFAEEIEGREVSKQLRSWINEFQKELGYPLYPEVFLTNKYGVNIAQTGKTSDYLQSDEEWWQRAAREGVHVGDVEFDESAESYALAISLRLSDHSGTLIGVMKVLVNIREIINVLDANAAEQNERIILFDQKEKIIHVSKEESITLGKNLETFVAHQNREAEKSWSVEIIDPSSGEEFLHSYARFDKDDIFPHLNWTVLIEQPSLAAFASQRELHHLLLLFQLAGTILCFIIGILLSRSITKRLSALANASVDIASGKHKGDLCIEGSDEIADLSRAIVHMSDELEAAYQEVQKLADIACKTDNAVVLTNAEGVIEWVNEGFTRITEYSAEEVIGKKPETFLPGPGTNLETLTLMHQKMAKKESFSVEVLYYSKTGREYWLKRDVQPTLTEAGEVTGFMAIEADITGAKEREHLLQENLQNQKTINNILEISLTDKPLSDKLGESLEELCKRGVLSGDSRAGILLQNPAQPNLYEVCFQRQLTDTSVARFNDIRLNESLTTIRGKDTFGTMFVALNEFFEDKLLVDEGKRCVSIPILGNTQLLAIFIVVLAQGEDCSDLKVSFYESISNPLANLIQRDLILQQLVVSEARAREATNAKSDFLSSMSHELRTPMNSIMGFTKRLIKKLGSTLSERDLDALVTVDRNAQHLLELINDILDLSKIEAGKMTIDKSDFDLIGVTRGVITTMEPLAEADGLELSSSLPKEDVQVHADRTKITQVLTNIISNAVKYTDSGTVHVSIDILDPQSNSIAISVKDTGTGIKEEDQKQLFSKFTQLDREERRRKGGTGLGLSITKEYVEMHGGHIEVESIWEQGSVFRIILPIVVCDKQAESQPLEVSGGEAQKELEILCVDDDPDILKFLQLTFEDEGYKTVLASNHDQAIAALQKSTPDLICLDICMPDKSGCDVINSMKRLKLAEHVPVMIVSAIADMQLPTNERVTCYLSKPLDSDGLLHEVRTTLATGIENVLVVEDCDDTAKLLVQTIEDCGVHAHRVEDGVRALEAVSKQQFSAIILDLMMPEMDGFAFLQEFKKRPESKQTPVFIMSAKSLDGDEVKFLAKSSEAVLTKGQHSAVDLVDTLLQHHHKSVKVEKGGRDEQS